MRIFSPIGRYYSEGFYGLGNDGTFTTVIPPWGIAFKGLLANALPEFPLIPPYPI